MNQITARLPAVARSIAAMLLTTSLAACHGANPADQSASAASSANALAALPAPLPMSTGQPAPLPPAPPVTALPAAQPVRVGRLPDPRQGYAYLDRAYYQQDAVEDAPPDYAFDDGSVQPWVWQTGASGRVICEPVTGGYRYYYYNPDADTPYLVRDTDRAYAYNGDMLVGVFTLAGAMMDYGPQSPPALYGARYLDRGRMLWSHADNGRHQPMNAYAWAQRQRDLADRRAAWHQQMAANAAWSDWAGAHRGEEQAYWQPVRARHQQAAQAFDGWQQQHFAGPQPQFYAPPPHEPAPQSAPDHRSTLVGAAAVGAAALAAHAAMQHGHPAPSTPPAAMTAGAPRHAPEPMRPTPVSPPAPTAAMHATRQEPHPPAMAGTSHHLPGQPHLAPTAPSRPPQAVEAAPHHPAPPPAHQAMPHEPPRPVEAVRPDVETHPHHAPPVEHAPAPHAMVPQTARPAPPAAHPVPPAPHPAPGHGGEHGGEHGHHPG